MNDTGTKTDIGAKTDTKPKFGSNGKIISSNGGDSKPPPVTMTAKPGTSTSAGSGLSKVPTAFTYTGALGTDGKPIPGTQKLLLHYTDGKPGGGAGIGR
jgi:hypothetical protein